MGKRLVQMTTEEQTAERDVVASLAPTGHDEWFDRFKSGEERVAEEIFRRYQPKACALCLGILKNETEAREAAQEALGEVARKIGQFDGRSSVSTWIYRVVANHALMRLRASKRRWARLLPMEALEAEPAEWNDALQGSVFAPDREVVSEDSLSAMETLCAQLPKAYCPIVALCDYQEVPLAQAAAELGLSMRAAKSRLHRGRVELRRLICGFGELCGPWCAKGFQRAGAAPL
ncbi:MAG: sigma-70 family RNA polymerase sigma factor [Verrucomicrobia bacterium]|nr:sigma-70 family RNA polymerase sigma factor [Verrucomicrobiota bacterium]